MIKRLFMSAVSISCHDKVLLQCAGEATPAFTLAAWLFRTDPSLLNKCTAVDLPLRLLTLGLQKSFRVNSTLAGSHFIACNTQVTLVSVQAGVQVMQCHALQQLAACCMLVAPVVLQLSCCSLMTRCTLRLKQASGSMLFELKLLHFAASLQAVRQGAV